MKTVCAVVGLGILVGAMGLTSGCRAFRATVREKDPDTASIMTAGFDQHDLLDMAKLISADVISHPFPKPAEKTPILAVMGIENRTKSHLDMKAMADTITTKLMNAGRIQFVNTARRDDLLKEQGYQLANCSEETKAGIGKQLGAKYMLTGSFTEIGTKSPRQVRVNKYEDIYYQLTLEITDLESGLIVLRKQRDRMRRAGKPIVGW